MTFGRWSLPRSEAPESFHLWAGLFTLASCLKRKVRISKEYFGGWECYPFLYVIFVAPPGRARKTTTAAYSEDLLSEVPNVIKAPTSITVEKLLNKLAEIDDSSLSIFSSEFAMFIQKSGFDMYDVLTALFDGSKDISVDLISRDLDFAEKPCVNLLACTTPNWISDNMPENVIGGGFASRVIFVFESKSRRYQLYYKELNKKPFEVMRADLVEDLNHIANNIEGDFEIEDDAKSFMEQWYKREQAMYESRGVANYRLEGYFQRKPAHVHKLAMLHHIAYSDELILNRVDFETSIKLLDQLELKLPQTFQSIGKNPYTMDMDRIYAYIAEKEKVTKAEILRSFYHVAQPNVVEELLGALIMMERVTMVNNGGIVYFKVV